jgi:hypothetical protein
LALAEISKRKPIEENRSIGRSIKAVVEWQLSALAVAKGSRAFSPELERSQGSSSAKNVAALHGRRFRALTLRLQARAEAHHAPNATTT